MGELGFVLAHDGARTFSSYAIVARERHELGALDVFHVPDLVVELSAIRVDAVAGA